MSRALWDPTAVWGPTNKQRCHKQPPIIQIKHSKKPCKYLQLPLRKTRYPQYKYNSPYALLLLLLLLLFLLLLLLHLLRLHPCQTSQRYKSTSCSTRRKLFAACKRKHSQAPMQCTAAAAVASAQQQQHLLPHSSRLNT